jgi:hypothetical protein
MRDPLAVERAELLKMIERLERFYTGLQDVKAGVSDEWMIELKQLRTQVERANSPTKLRIAWEIGEGILKAAAAELIRMLFETLSCLLTAIELRSFLYDRRRSNQIPTCRRWHNAARVGGARRDFSIHALVCRG